MIDSYSRRYTVYEEYRIEASPDPELNMCVVIPCYNETNAADSVRSLLAAEPPEKPFEVIVVVNHAFSSPPDIKAQNERTAMSIRAIAETTGSAVHVIEAFDLPDKHAGVGLARKIGMDEACRRLKPEGLIVCYDADSACTPNYLQSIEKAFSDLQTNGISIRFEHPLSGRYPENVYTAITRYELFLRYYNCGLRYAGLPYAYHTVGSSMAVRASAYMKQGGMNRRKAGEDFYFLHKIISLGNFKELNSCKVIPSPRRSNRVPFGTGKAVDNFIRDPDSLTHVYAFDVFEELRWLVENTDCFYSEKVPKDIPNGLRLFFKETHLAETLEKLRINTATRDSFRDRFFQVFDAFRCLKFVHFYRDRVKANQDLGTEAALLLNRLTGESIQPTEAKNLLLAYREYEAKKSPDL